MDVRPWFFIGRLRHVFLERNGQLVMIILNCDAFVSEHVYHLAILPVHYSEMHWRHQLSKTFVAAVPDCHFLETAAHQFRYPLQNDPLTVQTKPCLRSLHIVVVTLPHVNRHKCFQYILSYQIVTFFTSTSGNIMFMCGKASMFYWLAVVSRLTGMPGRVNIIGSLTTSRSFRCFASRLVQSFWLSCDDNSM